MFYAGSVCLVVNRTFRTTSPWYVPLFFRKLTLAPHNYTANTWLINPHFVFLNPSAVHDIVNHSLFETLGPQGSQDPILGSSAPFLVTVALSPLLISSIFLTSFSSFSAFMFKVILSNLLALIILPRNKEISLELQPYTSNCLFKISTKMSNGPLKMAKTVLMISNTTLTN